MQVQKLMSQPAITCHPTDALNVAAQRMWDHDCGAIAVVDDAGEVVGMITDRDVCMAAYTQGEPLHAIPVEQAMARQVFSCAPTDSVDVAERLMAEKQIRRVPVIDGQNQLVGVLSLNDVARNAAAQKKTNGVNREVVQTLAAICQPRPREQLPEAQPGSAHGMRSAMSTRP